MLPGHTKLVRLTQVNRAQLHSKSVNTDHQGVELLLVQYVKLPFKCAELKYPWGANRIAGLVQCVPENFKSFVTPGIVRLPGFILEN